MFQQILSPLGPLWLSALIGALPIMVLLGLLGIVRMQAVKAASISVVLMILVAVLAFRLPVGMAVSGSLQGAAFGAIPIAWIILNAVWLNGLIEESGHLRFVRHAFMSISPDLRLQALVVAFCFGSLLEAMAGFGAPIAVVAAILLALGFSPARAAVVAMFADSAGTAFGSMGNPIYALSRSTGLPTQELGAMVGRQSALVAVFIPFVLLLLLDGRRGVRQLWPAALAIGIGFGAGQYVMSNHVAFQLSDLVGALTAFTCGFALLRLWRPALIVTDQTQLAVDGGFGDDPGSAGSDNGTAPTNAGRGGSVARARSKARSLLDSERGGLGREMRQVDTVTGKDTAKAFAPYLILTVLLALVSIDNPISRWVDERVITFAWPGISVSTASGAPVRLSTHSLDLLGATGTVLLVVGIITTLIYRISPREGFRQYGQAVSRVRKAALTVILVMAFAYVLNYAGIAVTVGTFLAGAGGAFVIFSPILGWIGVAATGSDTSTNALFGAVQVSAARQIGISDYLLAAANSEAGALGKPISPQNLALAAATVGLSGKEGELFRRTFKWSVVYLLYFIVIVLLMAYGPLSVLVIQ